MPQYKYLFKDDAQTTLATGITAASTSLQVVSGGGALFPAVGASQAFIGTLIKNGNPAIKEVIQVTGRSGDNMTGIIRNLSGTGALTWNAGDTFAILQPAEAMALFAQILDLQSQTTNYAVDIGIANSYAVNLSPVLNGHVIGMPIRWKAGNTNTGPSVFNDGAGQAPLISPGGSQLISSDVIVGGIYTAIWDGTNFQHSQRRFNFQQVSGTISNSQVPVGAVIQWESSLVIAFTQLTGQVQNAQIAPSISLTGSPHTPTSAVGNNGNEIANTAFVNQFVQRGIVHVGDVISPAGGSVTFPHAFTTPAIVQVTAFDANNHGASVVAEGDGLPTATGFNWACREIASATEDIYVHWTAVAS